MIVIRELLIIAILVHQTVNVKGHGRLIDPPSRASMWRFGFNTPADYDDHQGWCGGFAYQQNLGGKCGICGDPWDAEVRQHEAGGKFATGTISKTYQVGEIITVKVDLTANHKGFFEFKLCVNNDVTKVATHECLDLNILKLADGSGTKYHIDPALGIKTVQLRLPADVVCSQCVFQWRYHTGNTWGTDPATDQQGLGLGPQEEFFACADISISGTVVKQPEIGPSTAVAPTTVKATYTTSSAKSPDITVPTTDPAPATATTNTDSKEVKTNCYAVGVFKGDPGYNTWCASNCAVDNCPSHFCACDDDEDDSDDDSEPNIDFTQCVSQGLHKSVTMDSWCKVNCQLDNCPDSHCIC